jgi:hypothetical protein
MFKLHFLKSVADVVASLTLDYQLIQNSLEFTLICVQKIQAVFKKFRGCLICRKRPNGHQVVTN